MQMTGVFILIRLSCLNGCFDQVSVSSLLMHFSGKELYGKTWTPTRKVFLLFGASYTLLLRPKESYFFS